MRDLPLSELEAIERRHVLPTYARLPVAVASGADVWLHTVDGRRILDLLCGLGVTSLGHSHPAVTEAIVEQAGTLLHTSNLMHLTGPVRLAQRLAASSLGGGVFFTNSGAEANEAAIKLARRHKRGGEILSVHEGFHGRTYGALSATPQEAKQEPFAPLVPGFRAVPNTTEAIVGAIHDGTAAVLLETIKGESGVLPMPVELLQAVRDACDAHDALLIFDEVQTGVGRTGRLWSYQATGVTQREREDPHDLV
ncbi:MAG: aminotransferase class III-fold pyridoxal phosphate-dependent enzyme, partial [Patulibacter sp.]|nr:aminotransferase class III-fold pyridoxal phosphate-dependent enzyme [Patulibacter sp.]